jgi:hypothetical protein
MDPITQQTVLAAAGAAGAGPLYVDDVFSTYVYEGTGLSKQITNGLDLAGEKGLVWFKARESLSSPYTNLELHCLFDNVRTGATGGSAGGGGRLRTDSSQGAQPDTYLDSYNSNGFTITPNSTESAANLINQSGKEFVSWSFRKAPGFFDVVTYNGDPNGNPQSISHNLGSVPGMILVKRTDTTENWHVYHRSTGATKYLILDANNYEASGSSIWNNTTPTSTNFTVGTNGAVNGSGGTYVAYIFAHDDAQFGTDGDESIIKCGNYTGNYTSTSPINLGFEPSFVIIKGTSENTDFDWRMFDNMRGVNTGSNDISLCANTASVELAGTNYDRDYISFTPTGFEVKSNDNSVAQSGKNFIYMAIRRPNKPPEAATEVFAIDTGNGSSSIPTWDSGFPVDMALAKSTSNGDSFMPARLIGSKQLKPTGHAIESSDGSLTWDSNAGWAKDYNSAYISYMFKRAPGFFDVVAYPGEGGSNRSVAHNLTVTPTLWITRNRLSIGGWYANYTVVDGSWDYLRLDNDGSVTGVGGGLTLPTSTAFFVDSSGGSDISGDTYIAYLFATLPGISKVGTYSGDTGNAVNVDCGFTNGARFVLIKRTDSSGHWYLWDTTRGYNGTTDNFLLVNSPSGENANIANIDDHLDALPAGFTVRLLVQPTSSLQSLKHN